MIVESRVSMAQVYGVRSCTCFIWGLLPASPAAMPWKSFISKLGAICAAICFLSSGLLAIHFHVLSFRMFSGKNLFICDCSSGLLTTISSMFSMSFSVPSPPSALPDALAPAEPASEKKEAAEPAAELDGAAPEAGEAAAFADGEASAKKDGGVELEDVAVESEVGGAVDAARMGSGCAEGVSTADGVGAACLFCSNLEPSRLEVGTSCAVVGIVIPGEPAPPKGACPPKPGAGPAPGAPCIFFIISIIAAISLPPAGLDFPLFMDPIIPIMAAAGLLRNSCILPHTHAAAAPTRIHTQNGVPPLCTT